MATKKRAGLDEIRGFFARMMAAASGSADPRFERAFVLIPREAFLPPGPWKIGAPFNRGYIDTPSADPIYLYVNSVVALDAAKGINTGEPMLHAAWLGHVAPQSGETVSQIGVGGGYFTAILSLLVGPSGRVAGFEIEGDLAVWAKDNLEAFENASITHGDATLLPLPASDVIYVNAGVVSPPLAWLDALRPGGRMIFPWRPSEQIGLALLVTRSASGFAVKPLMPSYFIACVGASDTETCSKKPDPGQAWATRSLWRVADRAPDETSVAVCKNVWFSSAEISRPSSSIP